MSEFNPFSAGPAEEPVEFAPEVVEEESGGDSRKNVVLGGLLGAVVLGAGAYFFLGGSGDEAVEEYVPAARAPQAAAPAAVGPATGTTLPVTSKLTLGRNPFRALYVEPKAAAAPAAPTGGTPTTPTTPTTGGSVPIVVVDSGPAPAPAPVQGGTSNPPPPAPAPAAQSTVELLSVKTGKDGANPMALIDWDGKELTGGEGDVLDGKLLIISIQQDATGGWFLNLQLGDGSPFELHERQRVVVR